MKHVGIIFLFAITLSGCSWMEYFAVSNHSNSSVKVQYELLEMSSGFQIFQSKPSAYKIEKNGSINWSEPVSIDDIDTSMNGIVVQVPSHTVLIFGSLSNDHYTDYKQSFINDRVFNLKEISIYTFADTTKIKDNIFDKYFIPKKGIINMDIR